jgi:hypothetical protein
VFEENERCRKGKVEERRGENRKSDSMGRLVGDGALTEIV